MALCSVGLAAFMGLRMLRREYLPLLEELERSQQSRNEVDEPLVWDWGEEE